MLVEDKKKEVEEIKTSSENKSTGIFDSREKRNELLEGIENKIQSSDVLLLKKAEKLKDKDDVIYTSNEFEEMIEKEFSLFSIELHNMREKISSFKHLKKATMTLDLVGEIIDDFNSVTTSLLNEPKD